MDATPSGEDIRLGAIPRRWSLFAALLALVPIPYYLMVSARPTVSAIAVLVAIPLAVLIGTISGRSRIWATGLAIAIGAAVTLGLYSLGLGFVLLPLAAVLGFVLSRGRPAAAPVIFGIAAGFLIEVAADLIRAGLAAK